MIVQPNFFRCYCGKVTDDGQRAAGGVWHVACSGHGDNRMVPVMKDGVDDSDSD